jgi:hypothetical protein
MKNKTEKKLDYREFHDALVNVKNMIKNDGEYTDLIIQERHTPISHQTTSVFDGIPMIHCFSICRGDGTIKFSLAEVKFNNLFFHLQDGMQIKQNLDADQVHTHVKKVAKALGLGKNVKKRRKDFIIV